MQIYKVHIKWTTPRRKISFCASVVPNLKVELKIQLKIAGSQTLETKFILSLPQLKKSEDSFRDDSDSHLLFIATRKLNYSRNSKIAYNFSSAGEKSIQLVWCNVHRTSSHFVCIPPGLLSIQLVPWIQHTWPKGTTTPASSILRQPQDF